MSLRNTIASGSIAMLAGCAPSTLTAGNLTCMRTTMAPTCAAPDPRIEELATHLVRESGRERFYARAELRGLARDRDELVTRLLTRHREMQACLPPSSTTAATLGDSVHLMRALLDGRTPADCADPIVVTDLRRHPRAFPTLQAACFDQHGLEDQVQCFVLAVVPLGVVDLAAFPLGVWFYAGPTEKETLELSTTFPPPEALVVAVEALAPRASAAGR